MAILYPQYKTPQAISDITSPWRMTPSSKFTTSWHNVPLRSYLIFYAHWLSNVTLQPPCTRIPQVSLQFPCKQIPSGYITSSSHIWLHPPYTISLQLPCTMILYWTGSLCTEVEHHNILVQWSPVGQVSSSYNNDPLKSHFILLA